MKIELKNVKDVFEKVAEKYFTFNIEEEKITANKITNILSISNNEKERSLFKVQNPNQKFEFL